MTEFAQTGRRHFCRHPRCRMKLPSSPVNNHHAFCTKGCHSSFYLKRCLVCEGPKSGRGFLCKKSKCRNAFRGQSVGLKTPIKSGLKSAHEGDPSAYRSRSAIDAVAVSLRHGAGRAELQTGGWEIPAH